MIEKFMKMYALGIFGILLSISPWAVTTSNAQEANPYDTPENRAIMQQNSSYSETTPLQKEQKQKEAEQRATEQRAAEQQASANSSLPACNSKQATDAIKSTLADKGIQLLDWDKLLEVSFDNDKGRTCIGSVVLNTGDKAMFYTFRQAKSDPSKILTQVEETDSKTAERVWAVIGLKLGGKSIDEINNAVLKGCLPNFKGFQDGKPTADWVCGYPPGSVNLWSQ